MGKLFRIFKTMGTVFAAALVLLLLSGPCRAFAAQPVERLDFLELVLDGMGMLDAPSGKDAAAKVDAVFKTYRVTSSVPAYAVINSGVSSAEMHIAGRYGLSPDHTAIIAAALKTGLITTDSMPVKTEFIRSTSYGWAAGVLARADAFLNGSTKTYTEKYLSDEIDHYELYNADHSLHEYIFDPSNFYWEDAGAMRYSTFTLKKEPLQSGHFYGNDDYTTYFVFIEPVYKIKEATVTVPRFSEDDFTLVMTKRISDIGQIRDETGRRNFAEAYMRGLVRGESDGDWLDTRHFDPARIITKEEAGELIERLTDTSLRYVLSPDLKMTRTTDLPESYMLYPYILDSFPNEYYDTGYEDADGYPYYECEKDNVSVAGDYTLRAASTRKENDIGDLIFPFEMEKFLNDDSDGSLPLSRKNLTSAFVDDIITYYEHVLNIDYRTIADDREWHDYMMRFISEEDYAGWMRQFENDMRIVKCDLVAADLSGVYFLDGAFHCKVYVHFIQEGTEPAMLYGSNNNYGSNGHDWLIQTGTKVDLAAGASQNPIDSLADWEGVNRYGKHPKTMDGEDGYDPLGEWVGHICTATGIPTEEWGEVRLSSGLIRSSVSGHFSPDFLGLEGPYDSGMGAVRKYMAALGF